MADLAHKGLIQQWRERWFGEKVARLTEHGGQAHWLSYLLVMVQSLAVLLAMGHGSIQLLFSPDLFVRLIAGTSLFLLSATVWAADLCLLSVYRRVPALVRNRQSVALWEHLFYAAFVLAIEGSTLGLVLVTLDTDPLALVSDRPIIPQGGPFFWFQIVGRVILVVWTSVQLFIVSGKLAPQWSTLVGQGLELVGGKAQQAMAALDMEGASVAQLFAAYAAMSRPPALIRKWGNGWLVRRQAAMLAEEDRQRAAVVAELAAFEGKRAAQGSPRFPTGGGSPAAGADGRGNLRALPTRGRRGQPAAKRDRPAAEARGDAEKQEAAFRLLDVKPDASNRDIARVARVSISAASTYRREYPTFRAQRDASGRVAQSVAEAEAEAAKAL